MFAFQAISSSQKSITTPELAGLLQSWSLEIDNACSKSNLKIPKIPWLYQLTWFLHDHPLTCCKSFFENSLLYQYFTWRSSAKVFRFPWSHFFPLTYKEYERDCAMIVLFYQNEIYTLSFYICDNVSILDGFDKFSEAPTDPVHCTDLVGQYV